MKRFALILIFASITPYMAQDTGGNRFLEEENSSKQATPPDMQENIGPPNDDDVPIGDYVPALAIVGVGLIAYYMRNRKLTEGS